MMSKMDEKRLRTIERHFEKDIKQSDKRKKRDMRLLKELRKMFRG